MWGQNRQDLKKNRQSENLTLSVQQFSIYLNNLSNITNVKVCENVCMDVWIFVILGKPK